MVEHLQLGRAYTRVLPVLGQGKPSFFPLSFYLKDGLARSQLAQSAV
jgi:hypothetical protein